MTYNYDPELIPSIELLPDLGFSDPSSIRESMENMIRDINADLDTEGVRIENIHIESQSSDHKIPIRIYSPLSAQRETAGLIFIHGGGFALGSLESEHANALDFCRELGVVVVSVDYRLAPEHPFPAAIEDCYTALCWTNDNAQKLDIDSNRLGIMGNSAGGGLAAGLALLSKDRNGPSICFQMLGIPELDDRLDTYSMRTFVDTPLWNRPNAILSWKYYLGSKYTPGDQDVPYYAAPSRATVDQLKGLPPAYVSTMEFDPLRDEGIEYALNLMRAGVNVELHSFPGTFHGSALISTAEVTKRERIEVMMALKKGLKL